MIEPQIPENEAERLHALKTLNILDTSYEERFDRVTRMAKRLFGVPISLVSLVDAERQWFKSIQGLDASETPREISFCGHAINHEGIFLIPDAKNDERFHDNPLVISDPNIRFYAGYPLQLRPGIKIGTLCLIDTSPREFSEEDKTLLKDLGAMIEQEIKSIQLATLDDLTLISNRRGFLTLADYAIKFCRRKELPISVVLFDLNKFKPINDNYGHHEGDFVLKTFSQVLLETTRECDVICRWGGDEFVALLTGTDSDSVDAMLDRFRENMERVNASINKPYRIEYSAGVTTYTSDTEYTLDEMIENADARMYQNKKSDQR